MRDTIVQLSLLPIDVGWDPRLWDDCHVVLPADGDLEVRYVGQDGEKKTVRGQYKHVAAVLRAAGYKVRRREEKLS